MNFHDGHTTAMSASFAMGSVPPLLRSRRVLRTRLRRED